VITFVLGGARSGKSAVAERLVALLAPPVTYVATLDVGDDADLAVRVEAHRARRPAAWGTVQVGPGRPDSSGSAPVDVGPGAPPERPAPARLPSLAEALRGASGSVLVDSLGPWVAASPSMEVDAGALCAALVERDGDTVVVSEEVGMSVHPATEEGLRFRDALGTVNQSVAACAHEVLLVVAGCTLPLRRPGTA